MINKSLGELSEFKDIQSSLLNFQKTAMQIWFDQKHYSKIVEERTLINSKTISSCPRCGSNDITKKGLDKNGIQRYFCTSCNHYFNPLTNTIFDCHKIAIKEWIQFLLSVFSYVAISSTSCLNRNERTTGFYWLDKMFRVLKSYQKEIVLSGNVLIDETYVSKNKRDQILNKKKKLRGISRNKICICVGVANKKIFAIVSPKSRLTSRLSFNIYGKHIKNNSTLIHDKERSHKILIKKNCLHDKSFYAAEVKKLPNSKNPLYPVNKVHSFLKRFLNNHKGLDKNKIQDWLNLFCFIWNTPGDKDDKTLEFLKLALSFKNRTKYREVYSKKNEKSLSVGAMCKN